MAPASELTKAEALDRVAALEAELAAAKTAAGDAPLLDRIGAARHHFWLESGKQYEMVSGKKTLIREDARNRVLPTVLRLSPEAFQIVRAHLDGLVTHPGALSADPEKAAAEKAAHDARVKAKYADCDLIEDPNLHGPEAFVLE